MRRCGEPPLAAALLLLCWAAGGAAVPSKVKCSQGDMFCSTRVVVDTAAGTLTDLVLTPSGDEWVDEGVKVDTPAHGQVFKIAPNRITDNVLRTDREFVSFHVLYDDMGGDVTVAFEYGENVDVNPSGAWCSGLPDHPLFAGEQCRPGERRRVTNGGRVGGQAAYLVTATTVVNLKDSGAMRDPRSSICFRATRVSTNTTGTRRCVYLREISLSDGTGPQVYVGAENVGSSAMQAFVGNREDVLPTEQGYDLHMEVRATLQGATYTQGSQLSLVIESRKIGESVAELPGQRWLGPTVCMETGSAGVAPGSTHGPCKTWRRVLLFRPRAEHVGREFETSFQAITKFPAVNEFSTPTYAGVACAGKLGPCPNGTDTVVFSEGTEKVTVQEWVPRFEAQEDLLRLELPLYAQTQGDPAVPPKFVGPVLKCTEEEADQATCIRVPHPAYANCPMKSFSFAAEMVCTEVDSTLLPPACSKEGLKLATAALVLEVASAKSASGMDAVGLGLTLTERTFVKVPIQITFTDNPVVGVVGDRVHWMVHAATAWTPPVEAMGHIFDVCVSAKGSKSVMHRCVKVEVKPCFYCTVQSETLHTIASKFQTNWMQIWSANHGRMDELLHVDTEGTDPWRETKNPNHLKPGSLIRLGPVYHVPVNTTVEWLLEEFRTTRESLMLANPALPRAAKHIKSGAAVCILPDICTQEREEWLRPKSKDSLFA